MHKFAIKVYGCQMNVYDGDKMKTALVNMGWEESPEDEAELVVLNGCSIRDKAEQKVWSDLVFASVMGSRRRPTVAVRMRRPEVGPAMAARFHRFAGGRAEAH